MMRAALVALALLAPSLAFAQTVYAPGVSMTEVQAVMPQPAATVPPVEVVGGSVGALNTFRRGDAVQPRITRAAVVTTDASGNWTVTWAVPFSASPLVLPIPIVAAGATQPTMCLPTAISATAASGKCWTSQTVTLNLSIVTAGLNLNPNGATAAGVSVQVFALPLTQ